MLKNLTRGAAGMWVLVIVIILVIAGLLWWANQRGSDVADDADTLVPANDSALPADDAAAGDAGADVDVDAGADAAL